MNPEVDRAMNRIQRAVTLQVRHSETLTDRGMALLDHVIRSATADLARHGIRMEKAS